MKINAVLVPPGHVATRELLGRFISQWAAFLCLPARSWVPEPLLPGVSPGTHGLPPLPGSCSRKDEGRTLGRTLRGQGCRALGQPPCPSPSSVAACRGLRGTGIAPLSGTEPPAPGSRGVCGGEAVPSPAPAAPSPSSSLPLRSGRKRQSPAGRGPRRCRPWPCCYLFSSVAALQPGVDGAGL